MWFKSKRINRAALRRGVPDDVAGDLTFAHGLGAVHVDHGLKVGGRLLVHVGTELRVNGPLQVRGAIEAAELLAVTGNVEAGDFISVVGNFVVMGGVRCGGSLLASKSVVITDYVDARRGVELTQSGVIKAGRVQYCGLHL